jgi:poly(3-hydroxybutyrate) depolymerase
VISKWCNWEVGISDPFKLPNKKMALLPLAYNSGSWTGNEYLQIYPRIERLINTEDYIVLYPDGMSESIQTWLKRK